MQNEQTADTPASGNEPTDQEAILAAQVDTIGDNPTEEPDPAAAAAAPAADPAAAAPAPAPAAEPGEATATDDAAAAEAAAAAAAKAAETAATEAAATTAAPSQAPAPAAEAPVAPPVPAQPQPPRDFDAALAENQRRYDEGEIEGADYQKVMREITKEEAQYTARLEIWAERQQTAAEAAAHAFNAVALGWEKDHAEFMGNPLRAQQMQAALAAVEAKTPGLAPQALFDEAAKIAFEAFNWAPKQAPAPVDEAAAKAAALAARTPAGVPPTLATSPAAAPMQAPSGNSAFASLDSKDISQLEDAVARMTPDQQEAYLRDAPGAMASGVPGST